MELTMGPGVLSRTLDFRADTPWGRAIDPGITESSAVRQEWNNLTVVLTGWVETAYLFL